MRLLYFCRQWPRLPLSADEPSTPDPRLFACLLSRRNSDPPLSPQICTPLLRFQLQPKPSAHRHIRLHSCLPWIGLHSNSCFPPSTFVIGRNDATATHLLLRLTPSLTPIGTIRLYPAPDGSHIILGRVAILAPYRKYGLGKVLMLAGHERAVRKPYLIQPSPAVPPVESSSTESPIPVTSSLDPNSKSNADPADRLTITVKLGAQLYAIPFYARYGYVAEVRELASSLVTSRRNLVSAPLPRPVPSRPPNPSNLALLPSRAPIQKTLSISNRALPLLWLNLRLALARQDHVASRSAACSPLFTRYAHGAAQPGPTCLSSRLVQT